MLVRTRPTGSSFDRSFDQFARAFFAPTTVARRAATPTVAARWQDGSLELTVDLPGTPEDALSVDVAGRDLSIAVAGEGRSWTRTVRLGAELDAEQVEARYVNGRLTVTVAPTPTAERRSVAIDTTPAPAIEASTSEPAQDDSGTNVAE